MERRTQVLLITITYTLPQNLILGLLNQLLIRMLSLKNLLFSVLANPSHRMN